VVLVACSTLCLAFGCKEKSSHAVLPLTSKGINAAFTTKIAMWSCFKQAVIGAADHITMKESVKQV